MKMYKKNHIIRGILVEVMPLVSGLHVVKKSYNAPEHVKKINSMKSSCQIQTKI